MNCCSPILRLAAFAVLSAVVLVTAGGCSVPSTRSRSYQRGYDDMMSGTREIVATAASQGMHESMAQVIGSTKQAATICEGYLQATIAGGVSGNRGTTPIPTDFKLRDYLDGCRAAGQELLKSGQ